MSIHIIKWFWDVRRVIMFSISVHLKLDGARILMGFWFFALLPSNTLFKVGHICTNIYSVLYVQSCQPFAGFECSKIWFCTCSYEWTEPMLVNSVAKRAISPSMVCQQAKFLLSDSGKYDEFHCHRRYTAVAHQIYKTFMWHVKVG